MGRVVEHSKLLVYLSKAIRTDTENTTDKQGGVIVFPSNKEQVANVCLRGDSISKVGEIIRSNNADDYAIGCFLNGRYTVEEISFDDNSLSIEIIGVDTDTLIKIAKTFCKTFDQEIIIVKDYFTNKTTILKS